jgi:DeoR family transcriptional regulator, fructose operon transcriptional repressor
VYAIQRHAWLVERARTTGRVEVASTCAELAVAPETIRRDLNELERQGLVRRVHGGAVPIERLGFEGTIKRRVARNHGAKARIAQAAMRLVRNADSIYLDEGSTVQLFAQALQVDHPLTVVTNSLPAAGVLAARPHVTVLLLGGRVRSKTLGTVDHWATRMLADLVLDLAVMGANGVSRERGLTCPGPAVAAVKSAACHAARRRILLADATKLGADSFVRFAALRDVEAVVTDRGAEAVHVRALRDAGVEVVLA